MLGSRVLRGSGEMGRGGDGYGGRGVGRWY